MSLLSYNMFKEVVQIEEVDIMASAIEIVLKLVLVITYHTDTEGLREILINVLEHKGSELDALMEITAKEKITVTPPSNTVI